MRPVREANGQLVYPKPQIRNRRAARVPALEPTGHMHPGRIHCGVRHVHAEGDEELARAVIGGRICIEIHRIRVGASRNPLRTRGAVVEAHGGEHFRLTGPGMNPVVASHTVRSTTACCGEVCRFLAGIHLLAIHIGVAVEELVCNLGRTGNVDRSRPDAVTVCIRHRHRTRLPRRRRE